MNKKIFFFIILVSIQILCIIILIILIYIKNMNTEPSIYSLKTNMAAITYNSSRLKYYYDLQPNGTLSWSKSGTTIESTYTMNNDGLNEKSNYTTEKKATTFRILNIGDSFAFGLFVTNTQNYSKVLEKMLNNTQPCKEKKTYEVINLGVPGYDLAYSVERLKMKGIKYSPDLIIWAISNEDLNEVLEIMQPFIKDYNSKGQNTKARLEAKKQLQSLYSSQQLLIYQEKVLEKFREIYSGDALIFTTTQLNPEEYDLLDSFVTSNSSLTLSSFNEDLISLGATFPNDNHPNIKGHKIIAEYLYAELISKNLLSCDLSKQ